MGRAHHLHAQYIISDLGGLADKDAVAKRLVRNQDDISNAIKPYYGATAGARLSGLLREHITIATEVAAQGHAGVDASKAPRPDYRPQAG